MRKLLLSTALMAGLMLCPGADAQSPDKAYAPENLSQLHWQDQRRVIEREYADQSGGRRIPDDQLEFYLEQIASGWGFSQIKQDIATSLGNSGGRRGGGNYGGNPGYGRNPGYGGGQYTPDPGYGHGHGTQVRCESDRNRYRECPTPFNGPVVLVQHLSRAGCIEGRDWGYRPGMIWVDDGCRAIFAEARGGGWGGGRPGVPNYDYSVTCTSDDGRHRTCAWDGRHGRPVLIENISRTRCVEGRNWGYDSTSIWVDRGCRARFGVR